MCEPPNPFLGVDVLTYMSQKVCFTTSFANNLSEVSDILGICHDGLCVLAHPVIWLLFPGARENGKTPLLFLLFPWPFSFFSKKTSDDMAI